MVYKKTSIIQLPLTSVKWRLTFSSSGICWAEGYAIIFFIVHYCFNSIVIAEKLSLTASPFLMYTVSSHSGSPSSTPAQIPIITLGHKSTSSIIHQLFTQFLDYTPFNFTSKVFSHCFRNCFTCEIFNHEISMTEHGISLSSLPLTQFRFDSVHIIYWVSYVVCVYISISLALRHCP